MESEDPLREEKALYRACFEQTAVGMVQTDARGYLRRVNRKFAEMLGRKPEELVGLHFKDLTHPDDLPEDLANLKRMLDGESSIVHHEKRYLHRDGTPVWADVSICAERGPGGELLWFIAICQDIGARKAAERESQERIRSAEEKLRQAQKMEAMGRLAGGIAHDFNNLLTAINGFGDLLLAGSVPEDPMYEGVREIRKAGERAAGLTRQLLAFSRKQLLNPRDLDLDAVVGDMDRLLRRLIGDDVALETRLQPDLPPILADRGQIEQVIMNLALNARDAMPGGGRLILETSLSEFPRDAIAAPGVPPPAGPAALLTVTDTGRGMDEETRALIFEPFFTTKPAGEGTGLGLATVYGIVTQSGGYIQVSSIPDRGTSFRVYLPLARTSQQAGRAAAGTAKPSRAGSETVLVAEDEDALRRLIERILSDNGYRVLAAANGQDALRLSESHEGPIHLLLTDVVMPKLGGRELAETLGRQREGMRLIYMSGYTDDTVLRHGILESKAEFLQKPFTPAALLEIVRRVLDSRAPRT